MEFVNIVNYKIYMDKDKIKNNEIEAQIISKEDLDQHNSRGVYMRDDHRSEEHTSELQSQD